MMSNRHLNRIDLTSVVITCVIMIILAVNSVAPAFAAATDISVKEGGAWETIPMAVPADRMQSVHTILLPNGKILSASGSSFRTTLIEDEDGKLSFDNSIDTSDYDVVNNSSLFDPETGSFTRIPSPPAVQFGESNDLFCSGHIQLPNGNVLFVSGTGIYKPQGGITAFTGSRQLNIYDWKTGEWIPGPLMQDGRWYPSLVSLANGKVAIFSGLRYDPPNQLNTLLEVYDPETGDLQWIDLFDIPNSPYQTRLSEDSEDTDVIDIYPRVFSLADGRLLLTGDEAGIPNETVPGTGQPIPHTSNKTYFMSIAEQDRGDLSVTFEPGPTKGEFSKAYSTGLQVPNSEDVLLIGGMIGTNSINFGRGGKISDYFTDGTRVTASLQRWISPSSGGGENGHWELTEDFLNHPRANLLAVILPTEEILVINGGEYPEYKPVTEPLLLTPDQEAAGGYRKTAMHAGRLPRLYHSGAVLLPDGRVLVIGGNGNRASRKADGTVRVDMASNDGYGIAELQDASGQPKAWDLEDYYQNPQSYFLPEDPEPYYPAEIWQTEIFTPPYLLQPGERAEILEAPTALTYGASQSVSIQSSSCEGSVVLIKLAAVTHSFDYGQRLVTLETNLLGTAAAADRCTLELTAPSNANLYPPGFYMMFYVNEIGKPSHAKMVQLNPA